MPPSITVLAVNGASAERKKKGEVDLICGIASEIDSPYPPNRLTQRHQVYDSCLVCGGIMERRTWQNPDQHAAMPAPQAKAW